MRRWVAAMAMGGTLGCYDDHGRGDRDAAPTRDAPREDAPRLDADGPRVLEEHCEIAWVREIPIEAPSLGLVIDHVVVGTGDDERVLATYYAGSSFVGDDGVRHVAGLHLGVFDARTGLGTLTETDVVALATAGERVIAGAWEDVEAHRARFVELDPQDGHVLRTLGTVFTDSIYELEAASVDGHDVLSFSAFELFGMTEATPHPAADRIVLWRDVRDWRLLSIGSVLGALINLDDGPTFLTAEDARLCADAACLGTTGDRHVVRADGTVQSHDDAERTYGTQPESAARLPDGTWLEVDFALTHHQPDGTVLGQRYFPADYNVHGVGVNREGTRAVTHTRVLPESRAFEGLDLVLPPADGSRELIVVWSLPSLEPLHFAAASSGPDPRSGLGRMQVGASGRAYVTGIADPRLEMCGRTFERSIFVIALE